MTLSSSRTLPGHSLGRQVVEGRDRDLERRPAQAPAVLVDEVPDEHGHVLGALAQRRHGDREDVQAVPEVLAEAPRLHLLVEATVRGGDQAHVDLQGRRAAHALELPVLDHPQQLGLELERQLADLVEEEGAAVGDLEPPLAQGGRPGEGALLVAEELALDERGGQGGAVELDEGPLPPGAQRVEGVGDEVLAHAGLALEEHGRRGRRHLLDLGQHVAQRVGAAHHALEARLGLHLLAQVGVVGLEPLAQPPDLGERLAERLLGSLLVGDVPVRAAQARGTGRPRRSPACRRGRSSGPRRPRGRCGSRGAAPPASRRGRAGSARPSAAGPRGRRSR